MEQRPTAKIIRFPIQPVTERAMQQNFVSSSERLTAALTSLADALSEQQLATRRWREAVAKLGASLQTLGETSALARR